MYRFQWLRNLVNVAHSRKERRRLAVRNRRLPQRPRLFLEPLEDRTLMAAWVPIGPAPINNGQVAGALPVSGRVNGIAADPGNANILYVATSGGGIWKSIDGGAKWTPLTDNPTDSKGNPLTDINGNPINEFMGAIAETTATAGANNGNQIVYGGMGDANRGASSMYGDGILVSTNGGTNWSLTTGPNNAFFRNSVAKIVIDPFDKTGGTAYADVAGFATNGNFGPTGIYKTTNFGQTWTNMTAAVPNTSSVDQWSDVVVDPIQQNGNTVLYAADGDTAGVAGNGVYKSINGGATWQKLNLFNPGVPPVLSPVTVDPNGGSIPAGTYYYAVTAVLPGGETTTSNVQATPALMGATNSVTLTWSAVAGASAYSVYRSTTPDSFTSPALITTTADGKTTTFTDTLTTPNAGAPPAGNNSTRYNRISLALFDGTYQGNSVNELLVSVGETRANGNGLYKMFKSLDGGVSFEDLTGKPGMINYLGSQAFFNTTLAISPQDPNYLFAGGSQSQQGFQGGPYSGGSLESFNGGNNWTDITTDTAGNGPHTDDHADVFDASGNLLDGNDGGIFKLTNPTDQNNQRWSSLNTNLATIQFVGISTGVDGNNNLIVYGGSQDNGTETYIGALGWTRLDLNGDGGITQVDPTQPSGPTAVVWAERQNLGLAVSQNGGKTFDDTNVIKGIVGKNPKFYAPYVRDASGNIYYGTDTLNFTPDLGQNWSAIGTPGKFGFNPVAPDNEIHAIAVAQSKVAPPVLSPVTTSPDGGNIPAGTYYYAVTAVLPTGETIASNVQATPALMGATNSVTLTWSAVAGATAYKVYRSTTAGSFTSPALITTTADGKTTTFTDTLTTPNIGAPPAKAQSIVYVSANASIFVSQDALAANATWTPAPLPNGSVADSLNSIAIDPTAPTGGTAYAVVNAFTPTGQKGQHVYYTTNFGAKWKDISGNLPNVPVWSVLVNPTNGNVYVGTDVGVYRTGKAGTVWTKFGTGLPNVQVTELDYVAGKNSLVIGTFGRGAWELGLGAPNVTTNPTNLTVTAGQDATFTAMALGDPNPTVQWQASFNNGQTWENIPDQTSSTLVIPGVPIAANGSQVRAVFTNNLGTATTTAAILTVNAPVPPAPPAPPPAVAASIQFTTISVTPNPFALTATETINVNVSQSGGSVAFAVGGQNVTASVDANGNATVTLTVPLLSVLEPQSITAAFNGVNATANASIIARWFALIDSTKGTIWNLFLSAIDKVQADGTQVVTFSFGGSPVLFIAWTPTGQIKGFGLGAG